jgi:DNA-binding transcriptional ArsR family regulator
LERLAQKFEENVGVVCPILSQVTSQPVVLDRCFHALSDATRREIVDRLASGPASVSDLAKPLSMSLPSVLQHIQVLEAGGLVRSAKVGRVRTCSLNSEGLDLVEGWISGRRSLWNRRLDELDRYLSEGGPQGPGRSGTESR